MELNRKQLEFWTFTIVLCLILTFTVLLVDFGIKAAILEESAKLRLAIEEAKLRGQRPSAANESGTATLNSDDASIPSDVLVVDATGMETGNVPNGTQE
jgi:hypothetical protein